MGKTQDYYNRNPDAKARKAAYDKEFNQKPEQKAKRRELEKKNREYDKKNGEGSRDGKDYDHAVGGYVPKSRNRGRLGEGGRKLKHPHKRNK